MGVQNYICKLMRLKAYNIDEWLKFNFIIDELR